MTERKIDGRTKRAAEMALAKKQISQDSYRAVLRGEISLAEARELGPDRGPHDTGQAGDGPGTATETLRRSRPPRRCMCSCGGMTKGGRFLPGHDARLHGELKRNLKNDPLLKNERFNEEQRQYAKERGLI